jgi:hypothetical protein
MIEVSHHNALLIHGALRDKFAQAKQDLGILLLTRTRDLEDHEREMLPSTLQHLSREQLREQIDAWVSLRDTLKSLCEEFDPDLF